MRITKKAIRRHGWGIWEAAVRDAKQMIEVKSFPQTVAAGRTWLRSLQKTKRAIESEKGSA